MKENLRKEKGITLIALVVTIIVLIILAGVSINLVLGDNGIIAKARYARTETEQAKQNEQIAMNELMESWDDLVGGTTETGKDTETETGIDFTTIINDLKANPSTYLAKAQALGQDASITDIAIGTDGEVANLGLWNYYPAGDGEGIKLGDGEASSFYKGYIGTYTESGEIIGKMPQYIYIANENKVYPVTKLHYTFSQSDLVIAPELPSTLKILGDMAFHSTKITSIIIPEGVTNIGDLTFYGCGSLTNIIIPNNVTSIDETAFSGCSGLENIVVGKSNSTYDSRDNCNALIETASNKLLKGSSNTIIPDSVISIDDFAFYENEGLTSITIPNSVTSIGEYAFNECRNLTEVRFEMITAPTFGNYCFDKQSGTKITFYFKNSTVANALKSGTHYNATYGTKSDNYSW